MTTNNEAERGKAWFEALSTDEKYDLEADVGDQLVTGNFVWKDWGLESKPGAAFLEGAESARNRWLGAFARPAPSPEPEKG